MSEAAGWAPSEGLVADVRHCLALAPRDSAEERFEAWAFRALLDEQGPALLSRAAAPSHLTASAVVLTPDARRTCLVLHGRVRLWVQPGGHFEPGDTSVAAACARETLEETGLSGPVLPGPLSLSRHRAPCRTPGADWHLDIQHVLVCAQIPPVVSAESLDVAWFDLDELPADLVPGVAGLVRHAARRLLADGGSPPPGQSSSPSTRRASSPSVTRPSAATGSSSPMRSSRAAANPSR